MRMLRRLVLLLCRRVKARREVERPRRPDRASGAPACLIRFPILMDRSGSMAHSDFPPARIQARLRGRATDQDASQ